MKAAVGRNRTPVSSELLAGPAGGPGLLNFDSDPPRDRGANWFLNPIVSHNEVFYR